MTDAALASALKAQAREHGADLCGIAPARALPESRAYVDWLAAGRQGGMDYMARGVESRQDIVRWYPGAKSVLLCGFSYSDGAADEKTPGAGRVARYARLPDYHPQLKRRLESVLAWLKDLRPGADGRVFVDTSPLLERLYARYAGLGWVGKNTMLIAPRLGSYFFLAGLAVNVALPADEPAADHCGSCARCLEACPTDAFPAARVLDAGRCISYLTIENKGPIAPELRQATGDWIMGCDVCQEVCPWNRFARAGSAFEKALPPSLDLGELAAMPPARFKERFGGTPLSRPKRRGMLRNALLAMGNSGDDRFRPLLEAFLDDPDPVLAEQAAWSLRRLAAPTEN